MEVMMAYFYPPSNEGKVSEFNSAALKMRRLDKILTTLNEVNGNLLAFNDEVGVYNYQLKFNLVDALYQEIESKLSEEERENAERLRIAIEFAMDQFQVYEKVRTSMYPKKSNIKLNAKVWAVFKRWLFKYETYVRNLQDIHGMDTAYDDDDGL